MTPECGLGMKASIRGSQPRPADGSNLARGEREPGSLTQDVQSEIGRAALLQQLDREMKVDVAAGSELDCRCGRIAGPLELRRAPGLDKLLFRLAYVGLGNRHLGDRLLRSLVR